MDKDEVARKCGFKDYAEMESATRDVPTSTPYTKFLEEMTRMLKENK